MKDNGQTPVFSAGDWGLYGLGEFDSESRKAFRNATKKNYMYYVYIVRELRV
jgi:hypothetical protein